MGGDDNNSEYVRDRAVASSLVQACEKSLKSLQSRSKDLSD